MLRSIARWRPFLLLAVLGPVLNGLLGLTGVDYDSGLVPLLGTGAAYLLTTGYRVAAIAVTAFAGELASPAKAAAAMLLGAGLHIVADQALTRMARRLG